MTYEAIKKMRLDHGARCTEPPAEETRIYSDWKDSKRNEKMSIPALSEPFDIFLYGEIHYGHVPRQLL